MKKVQLLLGEAGVPVPSPKSAHPSRRQHGRLWCQDSVWISPRPEHLRAFPTTSSVLFLGLYSCHGVKWGPDTRWGPARVAAAHLHRETATRLGIPLPLTPARGSLTALVFGKTDSPVKPLHLSQNEIFKCRR